MRNILFSAVRTVLGTVMLLVLAITSAQAAGPYRNWSALDTVEWLPQTLPDARIRYGNSSVMYGDLRLPKNTSGPYPVVVFIHGGGWASEWSSAYTERLTEALAHQGIAVWSLEFRRLGNSGGGWPGSYIDVAAGTDFLRTIAAKYNLNLKRVVAVGHSSGGHLALWLGGRHNLPEDSAAYKADPLPLRGVVSLAGIPDLEGALTLGNRTDVYDITGITVNTSASDAEKRFRETSPQELLPLGIPQWQIVGTSDNAWRIAITQSYAAAATEKGDIVGVSLLTGANHFDVVDPCGPAWATVSGAIRSLLGKAPPPSDTLGPKLCPIAKAAKP